MNTASRDIDLELPLVKITAEDVFGALLVHTPFTEPMKDSVLKLQTWILNFSEEQVAPLRESGLFSEDEIETIKKKFCVISPMTMALYLHWMQIESYSKLPYSEKERILLEKKPDRFKARYKGNAACRQAKENEEECEEGDDTEEAKDDIISKQRMSFLEFLKEFGLEVKKTIEKGK